MTVKTASLAAVPLFQGLTPAELEHVAARSHERHVEAGTEVIRQGDPGTEFLVVTAGSLEVFVSGRLVNRLGAGDFLGELALLFGAPRSATVVAVAPTDLLVMDKDDFAATMAESPAVETKVMSVVARRLRYR